MYYLIDSDEYVNRINGILYEGPFLYNLLGDHYITAVAYSVCPFVHLFFFLCFFTI